MSKDSKRIPERRKTRNYRRIIADVSQILRRDSPMHLRLKISANNRWLFGEYSAISRWSSPNIRQALPPTKHRQWFAKNVNASIENFGHREMLPHEYHEFRLFTEGSVIPPEHRLMLVNFHRECIGDAKKPQWDGARSSNLHARTCYIIYINRCTDIITQINSKRICHKSMEILML